MYSKLVHISQIKWCTSINSNRRRPLVATKTEHILELAWMMKHIQRTGAELNIVSKAVSNPSFKHIFHRIDEQLRLTNRIKTSRCWSNRNEMILDWVLPIVREKVILLVYAVWKQWLVVEEICVHGCNMFMLSSQRNVSESRKLALKLYTQHCYKYHDILSDTVN